MSNNFQEHHSFIKNRFDVIPHIIKWEPVVHLAYVNGFIRINLAWLITAWKNTEMYFMMTPLKYKLISFSIADLGLHKWTLWNKL